MRPSTISVIPPASLPTLRQTIQAGALNAESDLARQVQIAWKAPVREDDGDEQARIVEGFVRQGVQGIAVAPFDSNAPVRLGRLQQRFVPGFQPS